MSLNQEVGHPSCLCAGQKRLGTEERCFRGLKFLSGVADTVIVA